MRKLIRWIRELLERRPEEYKADPDLRALPMRALRRPALDNRGLDAEARNEGYWMAHKGLSVRFNPYTPGSLKNWSWRRGWADRMGVDPVSLNPMVD